MLMRAEGTEIQPSKLKILGTPEPEAFTKALNRGVIGPGGKFWKKGIKQDERRGRPPLQEAEN